ncbi:MAG: outer membrane protein [Planctomycetia bacterium]|jgi:hypothetical protein
MDAAASPHRFRRLRAIRGAIAVLSVFAAAPTDAEEGLREPTTAADPGRIDQPVAERRVYATGMIGSSLGQPATAVAGPLVAGQGACGVAVPRPIGDVRLEVEARRRQPLPGTPRPGATPAAAAVPVPAVAEEWKTMANVWHDLPLTGQLGVYAGGGIGVGMRGPNAIDPAMRAGLGWQAGAGVTYAATDRATFDVGYRYSGLGAAGPHLAAGESELLFAIRIYEPLRGLWQDAGRSSR